MTSPQDVVSTPILEVIDVTLAPGPRAVLSNFSLKVAPRTLHALVGPNGAGKTTLLTAILGLTPFTGRILINWQGSRRIAYVPQQFHVDRTLPVTVGDFLALSRQKRPVCFGVAAPTRARISRLLNRIGLGGFERRPLSALSGGELRRVLIGHALDPIPELLILDEPAGGLDAEASRWLDDILVTLKREMTTLMVSHDVEQVRRVADAVTSL